MDSDFIMIWIMGVLCSFSCMASPLNPNEREFAEQRQAEVLELNEQQRLSLQRSAPASLLSPSTPASSGSCVRINEINISGADQLPVDLKQKISADWQHRCLSLHELFQIRDQISTWYLNTGFITSRAFILPQRLADGRLNITVVEGKLQNITLNQQQSRVMEWVFPHNADGLLNLWDIEQGLEQVNRVRRQTATIDILAGTVEESSVVNLTMPPEFPLVLSVSADNNGQKSTCEDRLNGSLQANNLLGIAEQWYLAGGRCSRYSSSVGNSRSFQSGVNLAYGYWSGEYSYGWSDYHTPFQQQSFNWRYHGSSEQHQVRLSRILQRDGESKSGLSLAMSLQKNSNYLNDIRLKSSSYTLSSFSTRLSHSRKWLGGYGTLNAGWQRGLPFSDAAPGSPSTHFNKLIFSASYYRPLSASWYWLSSLNGQWGDRELFGSERLTLGGENSVRGFKDQYISGDRGGYWRNEVGHALAVLPLAGDLNFHLAVDAGRLFPGRRDSFSDGTAAGASLGIESRNQAFFSELAMGRPLVWPEWMAPDRVTFWYRVGVTL